VVPRGMFGGWLGESVRVGGLVLEGAFDVVGK
jgi:hypothetical protein